MTRPNFRARMPSITGRVMLNSEPRLVLIIACRSPAAGSFQPLADRRTNTAGTPRHQCNTCHLDSLLGSLLNRPEFSRSFDNAQAEQFKQALETEMPGARPGISFLSA